MSAVTGIALFLTAAAAQPSDTVLVADRYFDSETAKMVSPAVIVVRDGRIVAINPDKFDASAVTVMKGASLLPGFIDTHTHLTQDFTRDRGAQSGAETALLGASHARLTLLAGFTTVRDLGADGFSDIALARAIDKGWVPGPDIVPAGHGIGITGGHCNSQSNGGHILLSAIERGYADGPAEVVAAVRQQVRNGAGVIKICATAGVLSKGNSVGARQMADEEIKAAVDEALRQGLRVAAHAHGAEGITAAARMGVSSIEHVSFLTDEAIAAIRKNGVVLVPTLHLLAEFDINRLPPALRSKALELGDAAKKGFQRALSEKLVIAFGSDAAVIPHGTNAKEFSARVQLGQSAGAALQSATLVAARLLGFEDRGIIKVGQRADLIAVQGNPIDTIETVENVTFVMKNGVIHKGQ